MSQKIKLKKQLENLYLQALCAEWIIITVQGPLFDGLTTPSWFYDKVIALEKILYKNGVNEVQWGKTASYKNALKRYEEIKNSPLAQVMREEE